MKIDDKLFSFADVAIQVRRLQAQYNLKKETESGIRILEYCYPFAEYQYGPRIIGKSSSYRDQKTKGVMEMLKNADLEINAYYPFAVL
jgi:hypothetical protein